MYRINYDSAISNKTKNSTARRLVLTVLFFCIFCLFVFTFWPEGRTLIQTMLIPGDPDATLKAAEVFAAELCSGFSVKDAFRNFCHTVLECGCTG